MNEVCVPEDPASANDRGALTWACVEDGFYVASDSSGLIGFIDRIKPEAFQVFNAFSQQVGYFRNLDSAMRCLVESRDANPQNQAPTTEQGSVNP